MKYNKSDENIYINDIVKINIGYCKGKLGMVLKKSTNNIICVKCIANGLIVSLNSVHFSFIQHCTKEETKEYNKLSRKLIKEFVKKYTNIEYIKDNWLTDELMYNNITAKTLNKEYGVDCFNINLMIKYRMEINNVFLTGEQMKEFLYRNDLIYEKNNDTAKS